MKLKCCVRSCRQAKSSDIQLYPFPKNLILKRRWLMALNKSFIPRRNHGICSKHFIKESYVKIGGSFVLRKNAIPWYIQSPQNTYKQVESASFDDLESFIRSIITEDWIVKKLCKVLKPIVKKLNERIKFLLWPLIKHYEYILIHYKYCRDLLEDVKNNNI